ncbi:FecR family protein [Pseudomonas paraeruginosa]|uniref:FecR family protein n=1 Tax=Pseudomonas paraeruginosa TaxID=2994495 RepID=UPI0039FDCB63
MTASDSAAAETGDLRREAQAWVISLTSGRVTQGDARAFRQWCARSPEHLRAFVEARDLWQTLGSAAALPLEPRAVARVATRTPRRFGRRWFVGGALAASVALFALRPSLLGQGLGGADYVTAVGEQRQVQVSGGTRIEMNTRTRLNVRRNREQQETIEPLSGEAEIIASHPPQSGLRVLAGSAWLSASRARFNVRSNDDVCVVTCLEGRVVLDHLGQRLDLEAGQQLTFDERRNGPPVPFDAAEVMAWRERMLVFNDVPLATLIDEINRYRPGMLLLLDKALGRRRVQARFSLDQLADVATLIRDAYGIEVTRLPGGVVLLG